MRNFPWNPDRTVALTDLVARLPELSSARDVMNEALKAARDRGGPIRNLCVDLEACRRLLLSSSAPEVHGRDSSGRSFQGWCLVRAAEVADRLGAGLRVRGGAADRAALGDVVDLIRVLYRNVDVQFEARPIAGASPSLSWRSSPRNPAGRRCD